MPLEHTIACIDNSAYTINEDVFPSRLSAQLDTITDLFNVKLDDNPESTFGIISMGDGKATLRCALTKERFRIGGCMRNIKSQGKFDFVKGIYMAQLALKHRQGTTGENKILAFVASPINISMMDLEILAKQVNKSNYHIDIVSCGETEHNRTQLHRFMDIVNSERTSSDLCTLIEVDHNDNFEFKLHSSPIFNNLGNAYNNDMDDDLAMALALSKQTYMEETGIQLNDHQIKDTNITPVSDAPIIKQEPAPSDSVPSSVPNTTQYAPEVMEIIKELYGDDIDFNHLPDDIYDCCVEMGLLPPREKKEEKKDS
ncbi:hypothetical protein WA158_001440 [Blastocystis sp. Blastoise]